jgi:hypothetical protein
MAIEEDDWENTDVSAESENVSKEGIAKLEALFKEAGLSATDAEHAIEKLFPVLVEENDNFSKKATYAKYDRAVVGSAFSATGTDISTTGVSMGITGANTEIVVGDAGVKVAVFDVAVVGFSNGGGEFEGMGLAASGP